MKNVFKLCAFADEASTDLAEQITALKENNIDFLEIRSVNGKNISDVTVDEVKDIKKELDNSGIAVWSIGSPSGKIDISEKFKPHFDKFVHMAELAEILGASRYRLFSFYGIKGKTHARDEVMERLLRFSEAVKGSNIVLCHENEKDIYGELANECLDIHKSLPDIKAVFDPANFIQAGQHVKEAWDILKIYTDYLHIKDAKVDGTVVPAGKGEGYLAEIIKDFNEISLLKNKVLTLEPHLKVFEGLAELEHDEKSVIDSYVYKTQREAFDAAAFALKELL